MCAFTVDQSKPLRVGLEIDLWLDQGPPAVRAPLVTENVGIFSSTTGTVLANVVETVVVEQPVMVAVELVPYRKVGFGCVQKAHVAIFQSGNIAKVQFGNL